MKLFVWIKILISLIIIAPEFCFARANINNRYFSDISRYRPYRASATNLDLHGYAFQFDGDYWQSFGTYDGDGNNISFLNDELFTSLNAKFAGHYSITRILELR